MTITNLETVFLEVPTAMPQLGPELARVYMRSLQEAVKYEDLFVVARDGFEICNKILECEELTQSAALMLSGSFVSATLSNINIFAYKEEILPT